MSEFHEPDQKLTPEQQARRRLLKLGAYVPPAILGMAIMARTGLAQASGNNSNSNGNSGRATCCPLACNPCASGGNSNGNGNGGGRVNPACRKARHRMGC